MFESLASLSMILSFFLFYTGTSPIKNGSLIKKQTKTTTSVVSLAPPGARPENRPGSVQAP